jgi:hypothetical protein
MAHSGQAGKKPASKKTRAQAAAGPKRASANGQGATQEAKSTARIAWRFGAIGLSGVIAFVLLAGWISFVPLITVTLLVGGYLGLTMKRWQHAAAVGAVVGLVGGVMASTFYGTDAATKLIANLPQYFNLDTPLVFYQETVLPIVKAGHWSDGLGFLWVLGACVLCAGFAACVSWFTARTGESKTVRTVMSWGLVAVLCLCFLVTADGTSLGIRQFVSVEPTDYSYQFDAIIYVKTIYLMKQGMDYYPAVVEAASKDGRAIAGKWVTNGKMTALWPRAEYVRLPLMFQIWSAMGPTADWVVRWSEVLSALALIALFCGFSRKLSERALLIPFMTYPWLLAHGSTINVFFPDWWAALAVVFAIALIAADLPEAAVVVAAFGAILRFLSLPLLGVVVVAAVVLLLRKQDRKRMAIVIGVAIASLGVFAVFWEQNIAIASRYIAATTTTASTAGSYFSGLLGAFTGRDMVLRLLAPTAYYMYAYGFSLIPLVLLFPLALIGFLIAMRRSRLAQISLPLFVAGWFVYLVAFGPSSTYWGQVYTSALVIGTAALLATLDTAPGVVSSWYEAIRSRLTRSSTKAVAAKPASQAGR